MNIGNMLWTMTSKDGYTGTFNVARLMYYLDQSYLLSISFYTAYGWYCDPTDSYYQSSMVSTYMFDYWTWWSFVN